MVQHGAISAAVQRRTQVTTVLSGEKNQVRRGKHLYHSRVKMAPGSDAEHTTWQRIEMMP